MADAERAAEAIHREVEVKARELVRDARQTAEAVRTEGVAISADPRETGYSLRVNAERLLETCRWFMRACARTSTILSDGREGKGPKSRRSPTPRASRSPALIRTYRNRVSQQPADAATG